MKKGKKKTEPEKPGYILTMSNVQTKEALKAIELLMRLKLSQHREIPDAVLNWGEGMSVDEFCKRRDKAEPYLEFGFKALFPTCEDVKKDREWNRLFDLFQIIRKAIHDAEHPETVGVDSAPVICMAGEKMATCEPVYTEE